MPSSRGSSQTRDWTLASCIAGGFCFYHLSHQVIQFSSITQSCLTLCDPVDCSTPGFPVHHQLQEFAQIHVHQVSDAIQPSHLLLFPSPPAFSLSQQQSLSNEPVLGIRWPKYWNFSISPSNEYSGLISFRIDWFDLVVQGTLKNLLQHHSSKASILWHSVFFMVQLSYPYMTNRKTIALTRWTFVGKVVSLLFNILSRLVSFSSKGQASFNLMAAVTICTDLEPKKIKSVTVSIVSPFICHEVMELDTMILVFWMLSFKPNFSLSFFTFIKRLFSFSSLSGIRVVSSARLLIFLQTILIPACGSCSLAFLMMYSACKLNKPGLSHDVLCM